MSPSKRESQITTANFRLCLFKILGLIQSYVCDFKTATFTIYVIVSALAVAFASTWVPEARGRTLEEIQRSFR